MARNHDDAHRPLQGVRRRGTPPAARTLTFSDGAQLLVKSPEQLAQENADALAGLPAKVARLMSQAVDSESEQPGCPIHEGGGHGG
jgi:hypothetical protein